MNTPTLPPAGEVDIAGALVWARARIDQMDARVLLRHVLQCPAARLVAWPEQKLAAEDWANYRSLVERRVAGEPVAYLTGTREFYGRDFMVTPAVLIPRPETELLVELALELIPDDGEGAVVVDVGTGSGAVARTVRPGSRGWGSAMRQACRACRAKPARTCSSGLSPVSVNSMKMDSSLP